MTDTQRERARHALGLPNKAKFSNRNHYCIGKGGAGYEDWEAMVRDGLAVMAKGGANWVGDFFYLTMAGARAVLSADEHISREDAEKMRRMEPVVR